MNRQFSVVSNELASARLLLCPSDVRRVPATNFGRLAMTNISYALCHEADELRPRVFLATERSMSGFDFTGLPENINCFVLRSPETGARTARWRGGACHGPGLGVSVFGDGSVQSLADAGLVRTLAGYDLSRETDDGNLQFYFP